MIRFINAEDENRNYPMLDISDMLYEDDEFNHCDDDSMEISGEEREKRVLR